MKITVTHFGNQFNVALSSKEGAEPFLEIKGCRLASGAKGEFVSWPATKKPDGTWWRHCYASEKFGAAVLAEAKKDAKPKAKPKDEAWHARADDDDDIPF